MKNPRLHRREQPGANARRRDNPMVEECPHFHRSPLLIRKSTPEETEEPIHHPRLGRPPLYQYLLDGLGYDGCHPPSPQSPSALPGAVVVTRRHRQVEVYPAGQAPPVPSLPDVDHPPPVAGVQFALEFTEGLQSAPCWVCWSHNLPLLKICDTVDTPWALAPVAASCIRIWDWGISAQ